MDIAAVKQHLKKTKSGNLKTVEIAEPHRAFYLVELPSPVKEATGGTGYAARAILEDDYLASRGPAVGEEIMSKQAARKKSAEMFRQGYAGNPYTTADLYEITWHDDDTMEIVRNGYFDTELKKILRRDPTIGC